MESADYKTAWAAKQQPSSFRISEEIKDLALALSKFQGEVPPIPREATGHHRNKYATLDKILDVVRPVLAMHELALVQSLSGVASEAAMVTLLLHSSGQFIEVRLGLQDVLDATYESEQAKVTEQGKFYGMDPAQVMGAVSTYARRNGVCSVLGLSTEEDTDGAATREMNGATAAQSPKKTTRKKTTPKRSPSKTKGVVEVPPPGPMTNAQREKIQDLAQRGGFTDAELVQVCQNTYDIEPSALNFPNAEHLIGRLEKAVGEREEETEAQETARLNKDKGG